MKTLVLTAFLVFISGCAFAATLPANSPARGSGVPSQADINNDVSAMQDQEVQQQYQQQEQAIQDNQNHSDSDSNCPNCPH